jgi:hypothetical protein
MPPTEQTEAERQIYENKANIENRKEICDETRAQTREDINHIATCITKLTDHYSKKPTWFILAVIVALTNLCSGLILYLATH